MSQPRDALAQALSVTGLGLPRDVRFTLAGALMDFLDDKGFVIVKTGFKRKPRSRKSRQIPNPNRSPAHLRWIRMQACAVPGCKSEIVEAAHVRLNTGGGIGMKPPDRWTVPLCPNHHREQHQIGHGAFDEKYGLDLRALADEFAAASPFLKATAAE